MTWLDEQPADKVEAALAKFRESTGPVADSCRRHSNGDERFAFWLRLCCSRSQRAFGVTIFDIGDWLWRDAFDGGTSPVDATLEAFTNDDLYGSFILEMEV